MATTENLYQGDGVAVLFSFTFPYIDESDVKVSLDGTETTAYSLANATTVQLDSAPANGVAIRIFRQTSDASIKATFFPGSAVRAQDLNDNFEQTLFVVQETATTVANSDATSVLNIANQALSTAQAASTTANAAETAANNAVQAGENVSQLTNDAGYITSALQTGDNIGELVNNVGYLTPSDSVGDLSDVDITTVAPTNGQALVWDAAGSKFAPGSVASGGGGGGTTINYSGASAWGNVSVGAQTTLDAGLNVSSVTRTGTGNFRIDFTTAMPSANYSVVLSGVDGSIAINVSVAAQDANGFDIYVVRADNGATVDEGFNFTVHATNALPPTGGTGADAWMTFNGSDGADGASFNLTCTRTSTANYDFTFTNPMPTADYAVMFSAVNRTASVSAKTVNGFSINTKNEAGSNTDVGGTGNILVHAGNAVLPETVTQEQIDTAVAKIGITAWAYANANKTINDGANLTLATGGTANLFQYSFATPLSNANYAVLATVQANGITGFLRVRNQTTTGFEIVSNEQNGSNTISTALNHSVAVIATP